jgi:hypothetical protein
MSVLEFCIMTDFAWNPKSTGKNTLATSTIKKLINMFMTVTLNREDEYTSER